MGFHLPTFVRAAQFVRRPSLISKAGDSSLPKGYCAVYVGESQKKRFLIPVTYLNQPFFQELLKQVEEEFGYHHPMGGLTIPCRDDIFIDIISRQNKS